jgi:hypothetical protein
MLTLRLYSATGAFLRSVEIDARERDFCIGILREDRYVARVCVYRGSECISIVPLQ